MHTTTEESEPTTPTTSQALLGYFLTQLLGAYLLLRGAFVPGGVLVAACSVLGGALVYYEYDTPVRFTGFVPLVGVGGWMLRAD